MTAKRLIQGSYGVQRYLHSDEVFHKERNWNINLPSEREFKNGYCIVTDKEDTAYSIDELVELLNEFQNENEMLNKENKELKLQNGELLYQIGEVGKNNKTCRECECFIRKSKYCYMWDMEVEADDVVVACDQRKIKNTNEMINDD